MNKKFLIIFISVAVFASCISKKSSSATRTVFATESAEIAKRDSIIRHLKTENREQNEVSVKEIEILKSHFGATIVEKETNYTLDGKVANIKERSINYTKNTDSEKIKKLSQKLDYQQFINDSLINVYSEREQNYNNQFYNLQEKTEKKSKNSWYLWFFAGIIFNILINFFWKYFIKKI